MDELMMSLDVGLRGIDNKIPNINGGGCGIFALLLWDELAQLGMTAQAVVFTDNLPVYNIYHIVLKYQGLYIDSEGVRDKMREHSYAIEQVIPLDVLQAEAHDGSLWSDEFDRDRIPMLKKELHMLGAKMLIQKRESELMAINF